MALKDKFEKMISYFDTDEVSDVEEFEEALPQQADRRGEVTSNPLGSQERLSRSANQSAAPNQRQGQSRSQRVVSTPQLHSREHLSSTNQYGREQMNHQSQKQTQQHVSAQPTVA